ncbi:MAG: bile acid:sodium symporter family protein [Oxalobacter sp.]
MVMAVLVKIADLLSRYMGPAILVMAGFALFCPDACLWLQVAWVAPLLMLVMFGMGLTLKPDDFRILLLRPRDIIIGCIAQFTIMPLLAYALSCLFQLDEALMAGVILVGACPGGTASNVITYLAKGDVALSVGITSINTVIAPLLTPFITWLLLRTSITVDFMALFISIIQIVVLPVALGYLINRWFGRQVERFIGILPGISVTAIAMIVAAIVAHNAQKILDTGIMLLAVVILHNLSGYACGYGVGWLLKMPLPRIKALTVEIGMQNSGLASSLANVAFPGLAMATVPGALFSVWHNISGAMLAGFFRKREESRKIKVGSNQSGESQT